MQSTTTAPEPLVGPQHAMQYITSYNPEWPGRFRRIASRLMQFLPDTCRLHHVGSTSVPGMPAKDVIDIDIECPLGSMPRIIASLNEVGYSHEGDKGIPGREAFCPMTDSESATLPPHHLYACESGAHELKKHLAYRDYLIANQERAEWLASQKIALDERAKSREAYILNKDACYSVITEESLTWAKKSAH